MSIINRTKFGNCSECGDENVNVIKNEKNLYCLPCRNQQKAKQYTERASIKNKLRSLVCNEGMAERQSLINDLDFTFSRYIRIKEANENGMCECYTCGKIDHWKYLQCSHYIKRGHYGLRWDSRNAKPACINCNELLNGNINEYTIRLEKEYPGLTNQLKEQSREIYKYNRDELKELIIDLRLKLKMVSCKLK